MKALVIDGPRSIHLTERPTQIPKPGEVLVKVAYANICHTDHFILDGGHPNVRYPIVPGHEFSGVIVAVGLGVDAARIGERVTVQTQIGCGVCQACRDDSVGSCDSVRELGSTLDGGWQEFLTVPTTVALPLPPKLSLLEGSLTEPSANAYSVVAAAEIQSSDSVVVIGPGPIGLLVVQHARLQRPKALILLGLEVDSDRLVLGSRLGATVTLAIATTDAPAGVLAATSAKGADVVIQCAGSVAATATALQFVADRGRILIEGYAASQETIPVSPDEFAVRELRLRGVRGWTVSQFRSTLQLHESGGIQLKPLVTDCYQLADYKKALARSLDYRGGAVKVSFAVNPELDAHG